MKYRFWLQSALCFLLSLGIAVYTGRLLHYTPGWRVDLGGSEPDALRPETIAFLEGLDRHLCITYFVSAKEKMPSHLKGVEAYVRRLLVAMRRRAPERLDFRVIYPELSGTAGIAYSARRKVSPFSVRHVVEDEHGEEKVFSSLVLAREGYPEILLQSIDSTQLPYLEQLIIHNLEALKDPPQPLIAVAAPPAGFELLPAQLNQYGRVVEIDLDREPAIPAGTDLLFWVQPGVVTAAHLRALKRFVGAGRTAVLAGSAYALEYRPEGDEALFAVRPLSPAWETLLQVFGLRPLPDLLMDANAGPVPRRDAQGNLHEVEAPFQLRCLPAFRNMKSFALPARGGLNFVAASALEVDTRRLARAGFQAEIIATTTERAWVQALPREPFRPTGVKAGLPVPKQNLMVLLKPEDPWKGQVLVLASASPFADGILEQPGYAHRIFLRNLMRTFAQTQRLVRGRIARPAPPSIPPLGENARLFWRGFAVFALPLGLALLGLGRYGRGGSGLPGAPGGRRVLARAGGGLLILLAAAGVWRGGSRLFLDLTAAKLNTPAPLTRRLLERAAGVRAELVFSARASMPPALKGIEGRVRALLEQGDMAMETLRPGHLPLLEGRRLQDAGLQPFEVERVLHDTAISQSVWSGLRLLGKEGVSVVPRLDARSAQHLEFLAAAALLRLEKGRAPQVAVYSDLPRLSPAEALEDFQKKGLSAPRGVDVYSEVKALLRQYGYRVSHIDPRAPYLPADTDVFLWLQPRRDSGPVLLLLSQYLARGGRAIVALQHFNIQQRQYRGTGLQTVYWPQPQFQDLDRYLRLFGVEEVREVLMDRTRSRLALETQVNRSAVREYDPQEVALPFLIRAVGADFASASPITRHLGDLLFIWGNRFALDPAALRAAGLRPRVLVSTSDRAWSYPWRGGWLPPEIFTPSSFLPGKQPLVVELEGSFPEVEFRQDDQGRSHLEPLAGTAARPEGRLLLIGSSEMFKNDYLYAPGFQHAQFLLNAVAGAAYGPEMAALQARGRAPRGFVFRRAAAKRLWRLFVVGGGPALILLYGLFRYRRHHFPTPV